MIGGGLLGCFAARNLRRRNISVALLEAREDVCTGVSRANTAIVYSGCDHKPRTLKAEMICLCDRCGCEFVSVKETPLNAVIVEENTGDDPELFILEGDGIDLSEILATCFILDMETKFLCREDCKGLCPTCGKNLNLGPCGCRKQIDPRFAVLEQLLDK